MTRDRSRDRQRRSRSRSRSRSHRRSRRDESRDRNHRRSPARRRDRSRSRQRLPSSPVPMVQKTFDQTTSASLATTQPVPPRASRPTLPTSGDPLMRRVVLSGIPKDSTKDELLMQICEAITHAASGHSPAVVSACESPVYSIQFLTLSGGFRSAMVELRTPAAASVFMRCGTFTSVRRPRDYIGGEIDPELLISESSDSSTALNPDGYSVPVDEAVAQSYAAALNAGVSATLTFSGFPSFARLETMRVIFGQFGEIRNFQVGEVEFLNAFDAAACELALNGFFIGGDRLRIEKKRIVRSDPGPLSLPVSALPPSNIPTLTAPSDLRPSVLARINANPVLSSQMKASREIGSKPSSVVQLLNAVYPEDLTDDSEYLALVDEVKNEAGKFGGIEQVRILRPNPDMSSPLGCGKIFVHFSELHAARKFQLNMNGRLFDGVRTVCAAFYPIDRFLQGKFTLYG